MEPRRLAEDFDKYGWVTTNSENFTHPVAEKLPNRWGLYDMLGNVCEWVEDDFTSSSDLESWKIRDDVSTKRGVVDYVADKEIF